MQQEFMPCRKVNVQTSRRFSKSHLATLFFSVRDRIKNCVNQSNKRTITRRLSLPEFGFNTAGRTHFKPETVAIRSSHGGVEKIVQNRRLGVCQSEGLPALAREGNFARCGEERWLPFFFAFFSISLLVPLFPGFRKFNNFVHFQITKIEKSKYNVYFYGTGETWV